MLTRRRLLTGALGATAALLSTHAVPQSARKRMIVDSQVHLWKADSPDWPWVSGAKPQLPEPMTIERVLPLMDEAGVDRVIIVPPTLNDRNDYALEAAKRYPNRFAVMGRIPLKDPASAARLPKWKEPGMLGVRLTFNTPETIQWLSDGTADWFWPAAEKAGLPVMVLAFGRMPQIAPIAERHPGLPIIDHMGVNNVINKEGRMAAAIGETAALAKYPNVTVKLSNIATSSLEPYPFRDMTEHIRRVFDAFGPVPRGGHARGLQRQAHDGIAVTRPHCAVHCGELFQQVGRKHGSTRPSRKAAGAGSCVTRDDAEAVAVVAEATESDE